ncbi:Hypothetical protein (Fragment) [Durusdinium trenchii]|uniref:Serine protease n=1 Tax=Durusdinium trenchii TaxID=1381693 RepID=A0ABP0PYE3_9DINO
MNGPSARALREGGMGGSIPYKTGVTLYVKPKDGGPVPKDWLRKTTLQAPFGDFGQILRIDVSERLGRWREGHSRGALGWEVTRAEGDGVSGGPVLVKAGDHP